MLSRRESLIVIYSLYLAVRTCLIGCVGNVGKKNWVAPASEEIAITWQLMASGDEMVLSNESEILQSRKPRRACGPPLRTSRRNLTCSLSRRETN